MKSIRFFICALILLLPACGGNSLAPRYDNEIPVNSEPSGVAVYVMGEMVGVTPVLIDSNNVFPAVYLPEDDGYGHITLRHEGCLDKKIKISPRMISEGVKASLDCSVKESKNVDGQALEKPVKQRLKELQSLKDEGLISEQEYQKIRNTILKSL